MQVATQKPESRKHDRSRLCYVITHPMTTRFLRGQLAWMQAHGYDVTLISSPGKELDAFERSEEVDVRRIEIDREIRPRRDLRSLFQLFREFRRLRPQIVNAGTPKAGLLGLLAARLARVPTRIYTLHGLRLETTRGLKRRLLHALEWLAMRLAHRVVCVSSSLRDSCLRLRLAPPEKLIVLGSGSCNGLDVNQFHPPEHPAYVVDRTRIRESLGIQPDAFVLGVVGRITRDKGIADALAVFDHVRRQHPNTHLLLLGGVEVGDRPPDECLRAINANPSIHWLGHIDDPTTYYSAMDVLLHASSREGMPYVPLEAAAAGLPAAGYQVTGVVDAVRCGETGTLVPHGDVLALAAALCRYAENPNLRRAHGTAARRRVEREFQTREVWQRLFDEYAALKKMQHAIYRRRSLVAKRAFDLLIAVPLLIALSPLFAVVAILIRLRLGSPVLFWQQRPGLHGQLFWMPKFRSMTDARDAAGNPLSDELRLTKFGRFLRSTSLDELPELWCVVRGQMSLVGPRPLLPEYLSHYSPEQARRHEIRPGITGWAQINGRNAIGWNEKFQRDVWYIDHRSLALDLKILLRTVAACASRRGVAADRHATMPRFDLVNAASTHHDHAA